MIAMRYRCKIVEVGNLLVQRKIHWQYNELRHYSFKRYLPRIFFYGRQVAKGTRDRAEKITGVILDSLKSKTWRLIL